MAYTIVIDPRAIQDIQEAIDYYEEKLPGLGKKFTSISPQLKLQPPLLLR